MWEIFFKRRQLSILEIDKKRKNRKKNKKRGNFRPQNFCGEYGITLLKKCNSDMQMSVNMQNNYTTASK